MLVSVRVFCKQEMTIGSVSQAEITEMWKLKREARSLV